MDLTDACRRVELILSDVDGVLTDGGKLAGIFTDSDLARLLEANRDAAIDGPLSQVMTHNPTTVAMGEPLSQACELLAQRKLSELPVVDAAGQPIGLIDITDVLGIEADEQVQSPKPKVQNRVSQFKLHTPES